MEASLSFLGFYSECTSTAAVNDTDLDSEEDSDLQQPESLFTGRYCLAHLQLPNSALDSLQVRSRIPVTHQQF